MKRVLRADFFELRKSKLSFVLPIVSVLLGLMMPLMYFGIVKLFEFVSDMEALQDESSIASLKAMISMFTGRVVFLSSLPMSQGAGLLIAAIVGFRAVRPFGTGVYRNKVIAQIPRSAIYLSQSLYSLLLTMVSAALYALALAFMTRIAFGPLDFTGREILVMTLLLFGIYLAYTAIPVFTAFLTRSVPLTILVSLLMPILGQTIVSFASPALMNAPEAVMNALSILPSVQGIYLSGANPSDTVLTISLISDVVIAAGLTALGIVRFKRTDLN